MGFHVRHAVGSLDLLVHAAEHTQRHVGQIVTTARIVQARE